MIFKVFYQDDVYQVPVRELTNSLYIEGESEEDVRLKLASHQYNIEFITPLSGKYLDYEKNRESFQVETL